MQDPKPRNLMAITDAGSLGSTILSDRITVNESKELPLVDSSGRSAPATRDIARGWRVLAFWGGPLALILIASVGGQLLPLSFTQVGVLLILGTGWFGIICLVNALRCGRVHCWVDGLLLPALAVVGGLNLLAIVALPWSTYLSVFWLILLASIVLECVSGTYFRSGTSSVRGNARAGKMVLGFSLFCHREKRCPEQVFRTLIRPSKSEPFIQAYCRS